MDAVEYPELNCVVHGCAFVTPHRTDEPLQGFSAPEDGGLHLLCVHGEVGMGGEYGPIHLSADQLQQIEDAKERAGVK
jgi:hypothetical protein